VGTQADFDAAARTKAILDAGFPVEEMLRNARVVGMATARVAEANRELVVRNLTSPGDNERELAERLVGTVEFLLPMGTEFLGYAFQANLLEQVKRDVIGAADLASGDIGGVVERTVCFADLVEFTSLGEEIAPEELGMVVGHFEELATSIVAPPVRLVKTIGDAVMLVSPEAEPLVGQALDLVAAAAAEGDQFPVLRAGIATGPTLPQSGDYYGRSVNLASRVTGIARPGSVLVDTATREAAGEAGLTYSFAGERRLKGIDARPKLFRVRREGDRREILGRPDE
jgi:adenylate cyclase